jgi:hypothetical protein
VEPKEDKATQFFQICFKLPASKDQPLILIVRSAVPWVLADLKKYKVVTTAPQGHPTTRPAATEIAFPAGDVEVRVSPM